MQTCMFKSKESDITSHILFAFSPPSFRANQMSFLGCYPCPPVTSVSATSHKPREPRRDLGRPYKPDAANSMPVRADTCEQTSANISEFLECKNLYVNSYHL